MILGEPRRTVSEGLVLVTRHGEAPRPVLWTPSASVGSRFTRIRKLRKDVHARFDASLPLPDYPLTLSLAK